jgi:hypothetical protein
MMMMNNKGWVNICDVEWKHVIVYIYIYIYIYVYLFKAFYNYFHVYH